LRARAFGLGAPRASAPEIIDKLNREIDAALVDPKFAGRLGDLGSSPMPANIKAR
jgi:hypothetical protein